MNEITKKDVIIEKKKILDDHKKVQKFIFYNNDSFKSKWDILIMLSAVFNCFTIPFKVAFAPAVMDTSSYNIFNNVIDFIFLLDIGVAFRTAYINDYGQEIN